MALIASLSSSSFIQQIKPVNETSCALVAAILLARGCLTQRTLSRGPVRTQAKKKKKVYGSSSWISLGCS